MRPIDDAELAESGALGTNTASLVFVSTDRGVSDIDELFDEIATEHSLRTRVMLLNAK